MPELTIALTPELIVTSALAVSAAVAAILAWLRLAAAQRSLEALSSAAHSALATLREEVRAGTLATAGLTESLERLSTRVDTDQRHRSPEPSGRVEAGYELAIRLARSGAGTEELVTACGMTRKEAEVVTRLHGRPAAAAATPRNRLAVVPR